MCPAWPLFSRTANLLAGQLHIFRLDLELSIPVAFPEVKMGYVPRTGWGAPDSPDFASLLDAAEIERAGRYRFESDRRRFASAHGQVRLILGALLGIEPAALVFEQNPYGKPFVPDCPVRFNLSHSSGMGLLAVTLGQEVGVDIEVIRAQTDYALIAGRFFSREEQQALQSLPDELRLSGFFNAWTRKEAYIKARGLGLKIPLDQFAVSLHPHQPARLLHAEPDAPQEWTMFALEPAEGFCGAAVVEGAAPELFCWTVGAAWRLA